MFNVADLHETLLVEFPAPGGTPTDDLLSVVRQPRQLLEHCRVPEHGGTALDLGGWPGHYALALATRGFDSVLLAVGDHPPCSEDDLRLLDSCPTVVRTTADLVRQPFEPPDGGPFDTIVCCGEALLRVPGKDGVRALFENVFASLAPGGMFVVGFADLTQELRGRDRFVQGATSSGEITTWFLEYIDEDTVHVHDLVHRRDDESSWSLHGGSRVLLRLAPTWVASQLGQAGFRLSQLHNVRPDSWVLVGERLD
ncbi:class I SAM-dependent methyltransferase [Actinoalloteichus spitiensis]|uniref:class I SAM-dependent methyltransferase n=1 Tax=Actinoalloteichus spitiensis TaxID=252394 RepID=UPI0002FC3ED7|nr:class I SAM-dependent methyltransferase [Actinoalloteichus spitiensis]